MKIKHCFLFLLFFFVGCTTVPITGRSQFLLTTEKEESAMGATAYGQYLAESKISTDEINTELVKKVGQNIAAVSGCNYDWEFNLLENNEANAWCLPGGKVAVYTGILPYTQTEEGLATVMAHEIAHAIARHGAEGNLQSSLLQEGLQLLSSSLNNNSNQKDIMTAATILGNVGFILPYSRKHESEADYIGLILMARAGYDPYKAIEFWERMSQAHSGNQDVITKFLSTHKKKKKRIKDLKSHLREALIIYNTSKGRYIK